MSAQSTYRPSWLDGGAEAVEMAIADGWNPDADPLVIGTQASVKHTPGPTLLDSRYSRCRAWIEKNPTKPRITRYEALWEVQYFHHPWDAMRRVRGVWRSAAFVDFRRAVAFAKFLSEGSATGSAA